MLEWHVISLLIHGFLSVNARLLIAFGTAFYAIIHIGIMLTVVLCSAPTVNSPFYSKGMDIHSDKKATE